MRRDLITFECGCGFFALVKHAKLQESESEEEKR